MKNQMNLLRNAIGCRNECKKRNDDIHEGKDVENTETENGA